MVGCRDTAAVLAPAATCRLATGRLIQPANATTLLGAITPPPPHAASPLSDSQVPHLEKAVKLSTRPHGLAAAVREGAWATARQPLAETNPTPRCLPDPVASETSAGT
jgi:hypothetical protein